MGVKRYTKISDLVKDIKDFSEDVKKKLLTPWDKATLETLGEAKGRTPLVSGDLQRSGRKIKAVFTDKGIESKIVFSVPYAKVIETGIRNGKQINLKPVGYVYKNKFGSKTKSRRGEIGFLSNAIDDKENIFTKSVKKILGKVWSNG